LHGLAEPSGGFRLPRALGRAHALGGFDAVRLHDRGDQPGKALLDLILASEFDP
jgi:hypothetical protein